MAVRRWLTGQYDRTGHGAKLYTSERAAWKVIVTYALLPLALLLVYHLSGIGQIVTDQVALNTFAPVMLIWAVVLIDFALLGRRLFRNVYRMIGLVMGDLQSKIPIGIYLQELKTLAVHATTQRRWRDCSEDQSRWLKHLLLVSGYVTMLVLVVGLLWWFQTDEIYPLWHPQRWLGYYATAVLLIFSGEAIYDRFRKRDQLHRFSHPTDWLFPAFLFVGALTGILVHIFRYAGWPWPTYILYTVHLMAMFAMLDSEVGIGKWTHLAYRPLAVYLDAVKQRAAEQPVPGLATAAAD